MQTLRRLALVLALVLPGLPAAAQEEPSSGLAGPPKVRAELVAPRTAVGPGRSILLGLHQRIEPGWHTYWKNPGDSGQAPSIDWRLPDGVEAGPIQWPAPERIPYFDLVNYGYEGEVVLPSLITLPRDWPADRALEIEATAEWLVCADICIPESADLHLTLDVGSGGPSEHAPLFDAFEQNLPNDSPWPARYSIADDALVIRLEGDFAQSRIVDATFFPADGGIIEHAAAQRLAAGADGLTVSMQTGETPPDGEIEGVLKITEEAGDEQLTQALAITASRTEPSQVATARGGIGVIDAMLLAVLGGLVLNLMPCVFPVLSLKALGLVRDAHSARRTAAGQGLAYTGGILTTFGLLAIAMILLRAAGNEIGWGVQLQEPLIVTLLAYLFLAFGLNLSGLFQVGSGLMGLGDHAARRGGYTGSYFTGALAVIVATPCVAPFMGVALGFALSQSAPVTLLVFLCLGLGLALPYLVLSLAPGLGRMLPRPGAWMERFKQFLAFPMYASAGWLLWVLSQQLPSQTLLAVIIGGVLLAMALWLLGLRDGASDVGRRRLAGGLAIASLLAALALVPGLLMPAERTARAGETAPSERLAEAYDPQRLDELQASGRPVLINLTAAWCITCKVNDRVALSGERFEQALKRHDVAYLKGDWTNRDEEVSALLERFGRSGVPLYLLFPPDKPQPEILPQILTQRIVLDAIERAVAA